MRRQSAPNDEPNETMTLASTATPPCPASLSRSSSARAAFRPLLAATLAFTLSACGANPGVGTTAAHAPSTSSGADASRTAYDLGTQALDAGDFAEAVVAFTWALDGRPGWEEARLNRGLAWASLGRLEQARPDLHSAWLRAPSDARAAYHYAWLLRASGEVREALNVLDGARGELLLDERRYLTALAWLDLEDPERASDALSSIASSTTPQMRCAHARVAELRGDIEEATQRYEEVLDESPHHLSALYNLSALLVSSDPARAAALLDLFLQEAPDDDIDRPSAEARRGRLP